MHSKNIFLMLTLFGSMIMMMLVSILFSLPNSGGLQASMTPKKVFTDTVLSKFPKSSSGTLPAHKTEEVLHIMQEYVTGNDREVAKKLYKKLYADTTIGGEIESKN